VAAAPTANPELGQIVKQRTWTDKNTGLKVTAPPVFEGDAKQIKAYIDSGKDLQGYAPVLGPRSIEPAANTFLNRLSNTPFKDWYYKVRDAGAASSREYREVFVPELEGVQKGLPRGSSKRIGAWMAAQDPTGAATLKGMGVEVPTLTPQEAQGAKWLSTKWEELYSRLNDARTAAGKAPFEKVPNYYTFIRKMGIWQELGADIMNTDTAILEKIAANYANPRTTPFRFARKRIGGFDPIETDAFSVMRSYAKAAFDHIHISPEIGKFREMLGNINMPDNTRISMRDSAPNTYAFLTNWLNHVSGKPDIVFTPAFDRTITAISRNNAFASLSGYLGSVLKQPAAILNTVVEIGPKYAALGVIDNMNPKWRSFADKIASSLATRQYDASINDAMATTRSSVAGVPGKIIEGAKKIQKGVGYVGIKPLEIADYETARSSWLGAYRMATDKLGLAGKEAYNFANDVVVKTQSSASKWDVAPFQRTSLGRVASPLQTFVMGEWSWLMHDVLGLGNKAITNKDAFKKATGVVVSTFLYNTLSEDVLGVPSPRPSPLKAAMEARQDGESVPWAVTKEMGQMLPIIGGGLKYGRAPLGASLNLMENAFKGGTGEMSLAEIAGRMAGIPGTMQASRLSKVPEKLTMKEALVGRNEKPQKSNPWGGWSD
jgi:hypothetical protein